MKFGQRIKFFVCMPILLAIIVYNTVFVQVDSCAHADNYIILPGMHFFKRLLDGTTVEVTLSREHALVTPSMVSVFVVRNVWVSGVYHMKVVTPPGVHASTITLNPGYFLACQIAYNGGAYTWNGAQIGGQAEFYYNAANANPLMLSPWGYINFGANQLSLSITPGQAVFHSVLSSGSATTAMGSTAIPYAINASTGEGGVAYDDTMAVTSSCVTLSTARAVARIMVQTDTVKADMTMWGKPFSTS